MNAYKRASQVIQKAKGPKWKQELVSDHKFDFLDVEEFREHTFMLTLQYFILLCNVIISFMVYGADIWTACILLIYDKWSLSTPPKIPLYISKWIYVGCIGLSFMLLAWEVNKTKNVMATRDISLAVTNPLAYRTYSVKSYSYFCLLYKIKKSTRWSDVIIFYVFYTLKGWKRVIVAQGPRQIIAGITLYALLYSAWTDANGNFKFSDNWETYGNDWQQRLSVILMSFTCLLWLLSFISLFVSAILYFFILCQIQGNLKEYCCHKIDKRIDEMLQKQRKKRLREMEKERNYAGSISSKKSKKSGNNQKDVEPMPALPTLPVFNDASLYTGEQNKKPWLYQQAEQQDSFYYESQQMTPLESSYSLQRNPTNKYSPYNETPMVPYQQNYYQPTDNYINNYYNAPNAPQYSTTIANPPNTIENYSNYNQNSASNLHEYDSYQRSNTYDVYATTQSSPSLATAVSNAPRNNKDSQYTESPKLQNSSDYTQKASLNDKKMSTVDDYYYDEHNSYPMQETNGNYYNSHSPSLPTAPPASNFQSSHTNQNTYTNYI